RKRGKCLLCHSYEPAAQIEGVGEHLPVMANSSIPTRWFVNSNFDHRSHVLSKCIDCHAAAPRSVATADVLLPKAATCKQCHNPEGVAGVSCLECHLFHESPLKAVATKKATAAVSK